LVLIDGFRVNSPTTGAFDFADLTTDNVERIEIVRGSQSTLYGSDAIGGVINIITKKGEGRPRVTLSAGGGSHESFRETIDLSGALKPFNFSLTASRWDTDGFLVHDDYQNTTVSWRGDVALLPTVGLQLTGRFTDAGTNLPPVAGRFFDPNQSQQTTSRFFSTRLVHRPFPFWESRVGFSFVNEDLLFKDPANPGFEGDFTSRIETSIATVDLQQNLFLGKIDTVTAGFEWRQERGEAASTGPFASPPFTKTITNPAVYIQNFLTLFDRLFVVVGGRFDDHSQAGSELTGRASVAYLLKETGTKFKGTIATGFKAPSLNALFFPGFGDPTLKPEESTSYEGGIEQKLFGDLLRLEAVYFRILFRDLISFVPTADPAFPFGIKAANIGRARSEGVEFQASVKPLPGLTLRGTYTFLEAIDRDTREPLLRRPKHKGGLSANYTFLERFNVNVDVTFVGRRPDFDPLTFAPIKNEGYTKLDLAASWNVVRGSGLLKNLQLFVKTENVLDERYDEAKGFPAARFHLFGGLRGEF
ncbi:MAG: TonB-dependent receptor plug domain-containing protein, partial [Candidatus Methylomirabilales bacterium]